MFCAVHPAYRLMAIKWRPAERRVNQTRARPAKVDPVLASDRALILLKERMIFSPNRLHFADHALIESNRTCGVGRLLRACFVTLAFSAPLPLRARRKLRQFRPSGRRLSEFTGGVGRSGGLCAGMRARPAVPGLELQLPDRYRRRRGLLAEEQRAPAHPGQIAASRACAAPAWSNRAMARSKPRSTGPAATMQFRTEKRRRAR